MNDNSASELKKIIDWLQAGSINLFGMPYAGKDTQGTRIAELFDAPLLGGGDILRNSVIPQNVREIMHAGNLIPTDDYLHIVLPYLSKQEFKDKPLILSSVGRWHGEEEGVIQATRASGHPLKAVVFLSISEATLRKRWEASQDLNDRESRADDAEHVLETRLNEFKHKTLPVIDTYRQRGLLIEVDGEAPMTEVTNHIIEKLVKFSKSA